jgi:hypothetical protein
MHHVVPAVAQRDPLDERELIVSVHVPEAANSLMACASIELDQDLIVVIANIACVWQAVSALLSIPARQPVWAFDVMEEPHLQWRLCTRCHVTQDVSEESPMLAAAALVHSLEKPTRCRPPALDCLGDQRDEIGLACRR